VFDPDTCYDVAVFGGGLCGFAAARDLARRGHRVALIERRPVLGWEITWAYVFEPGEPSSGAGRWLADAVGAAGGFREGGLDPAITEMVLDREAAAAGIDVLLYAQPVAIGIQDDRVSGVLLGTKSGEVTVRARAFVDATENALLWRLAGGQAEPPAEATAWYAFFLGNLWPGEAHVDHAGLGDVYPAINIQFGPGKWPDEFVMGYCIECCDIGLARRAWPDVLGDARRGLKIPAKALVTAASVEPYPFSSWRMVSRPNAVRNLFPAGPWVGVEPTPHRGVTPSQRLAIGDAAVEAIAVGLAELPAITRPAPLPHSQVAPPAHEADVVVCGGGTGGALAAIAAARQGAKTILIEQSTCLGGIGTGGGIHSYYHGVAGGLQDELDRRVADLVPLFGPAAGFHPEAKKVALELMAAEAGVEVVYSTTITGAQTESVPSRLPAKRGDTVQLVRRLRSVVAAGPDGNALYRAKAFVDGTGDGDLAAMAGAQFTFGRATDGLPHAYSLAAGRLSDDGKLLITNFDAGYCDPTDAVDMTRARRRALGHYWRERFDAKTRLVYIAPILGLRNSRQVVGDYRLTMGDEIAGRQFPDVIAYAYSHYDNHGFDYENESDEAMLWVWLLGNWGRRFGCEIPYRCLLPAGVEGLLMACRALSITHDAHNQLRMQRDLQRIGEAAGIAAALAAARGLTPRELPVEPIQAALLKSGALGPPPSPALRGTVGLPDRADTAGQASRATTSDMALAPAEALHESAWMPPQVPALPLAQRVAELGTEKTSEATFNLIRRGREALPLLLDAAKAEKPATRFWASVALAMLKRPEAAPELRAALAERRADVPEGRKAAPLWKSAAVLLGRIADRAAVPELCKLLDDPQADLDARIAAVRALGRIADPAAAPALNALADRTDIVAERVFQVSVPGASPAREDARWQLDLAIAEALARLGAPRPGLAARHAADERAYVRRYAQNIQELSSGKPPQ